MGAGHAALGDEPGPPGEVEDDDAPEHDLEGNLAGLVVKEALGEEGAGPAAERLEKMERGLGRAPVATLRLGFIEAVGGEGEQAHAEVNPGNPPGQGVQEGGGEQGAQDEEREAGGEKRVARGPFFSGAAAAGLFALLAQAAPPSSRQFPRTSMGPSPAGVEGFLPPPKKSLAITCSSPVCFNSS